MRFWPLVLLLTLIVGGMASHAATRGSEQAAQRRAKARYYYLRGVEAQSMDQNAEAAEFYHKAYSVDASYDEAAMMHGMFRMMAPVDTLMSDRELLASVDMVRRYVDAHPGDRTAVDYYVALAASVDTLPEIIRVYTRLDSVAPGESGTYLRLAQAYREAGQFDSVVSMLDRYQSIEGISPHVTMQKVAFNMMRNDTVAALREVADLIASNPKRADYRLIEAKTHEIIGDSIGAFKALVEAETIDPESGTVKRALADYYLQRGDSVSYDRKTYESLLSEDLDLNVKLGIMATYLQRIIDTSADTKRGDALFASLREQYPLEPELLYLAARYAAAKRNLPEARELMGYVTGLNNSNPEYWRALMMYAISDNAPQDAITAFRQYEETAEDISDDMRMMYATAYSTAGQHREAVVVYDTLIKKLHPALSVYAPLADRNLLRSMTYDALMSLSLYYQLAGDEYQQMDSLQDAYRSYDSSLGIDPDNVLVLNNYAYFILEREKAKPGSAQFEKARTMINRAIALEGENPTYLDTYAWLLFKDAKYVEAEEIQRKAIRIAKDKSEESAEYYEHLGDILYFSGDRQGAVLEWERALQLDPDNKVLKKKVKQKTYIYQDND